ncbi:hypothetical protein JX265_002814 [Neoarthrinium moseri]|uniref:DUF159-domain-containing protein n=1 Tax=Neoarthrinium moseri TaxID=1658444 RepID=A0A9Q0ATH0_9PEZI|nr:hypothetical protein JX265_002814 [Neoarthrinium moseri]
MDYFCLHDIRASDEEQLDSEGDLFLQVGENRCLGSRQHPGQAPKGDDDHNHTHSITFRVSSQAIKRVTPVWKRMLSDDFAEARPTDGSQWRVRLPEDNPHALRTIFNIVYGQFKHIPQRGGMPLDDLHNLTVVTDKYDLTHLLQPWAAGWMTHWVTFLNLKDGIPTKAVSTKALEKVLWISWELGHAVLYSAVTKQLALQYTQAEAIEARKLMLRPPEAYISSTIPVLDAIANSMCGRYSLALRPAQIRQMLQDDDMPVDEAPGDEDDGAPRQSYNFAPGYHGIVYRADVPDWGAGPRRQAKGTSTSGGDSSVVEDHETAAPPASQGDDEAGSKEVHYKLQSMKWGLIPFWTKRNPDYGSMMKTINCRDDSLAQSGGMWNTMKARKRCIVVAQGFYEWLKKDGSKEKIPHFVKRKDGHLMCFAGLWDCVAYENEETKHFTYTIITTDSNKQLRFLHDRMPVILNNGSEQLRTWLDPKRYEWTKELQSLLKPFDGELEVYPVSKDVGKVGNNSPTFIVPINSKENKSNIANFFAKGASKPGVKKEVPEQQPVVKVKKEDGFVEEDPIESKEGIAEGIDKSLSKIGGVKREAEDIEEEDEPPKKVTRSSGPVKSPSPQKGGRPKISSTSNGTKSPQKSKQAGAQKITKFFGNSA